MLAYFNGNKLPLNADFMPITQGKSGEDLNSIKTNQMRTYNVDMSKVKNTPINSGWFSLIVIMQDQTSGTQFVIQNAGKCRLFLRSMVGSWWQSWYEIPLSDIKN